MLLVSSLFDYMYECVFLVNALYNPDREGYLYKLSTGRVRGWKRRWVVLTEKVKRY